MPPITRSSSRRTILQYLNEDCWRILLSYLPIDDIICSERVSKKWQSIVLRYLRSVRICIEGAKHEESRLKDQYKTNCRYKLDQECCSSFKLWARKLGTSIVAVYCTNEESWEIYKENCPNLESITFSHLEDSLPISTENENLKCLRRLWYENCEWESERTIEQFLNNPTLEDLEIEVNHAITGGCFKDIKSKLQSLNLYYCKSLELGYLVSAVDSFTELKRLRLIGVDGRVYEEIPVMLSKLKNLEHLHLRTSDRDDLNCDDFFESVCRMGSLKDLNVNCRASDAHLEAVTRCCKELHSLHIGAFVDCVVTSGGVNAVCRNAGERLTSLAIHASNHVTNDDVVNCVRSCPNLKFLDLRGCRALSAGALGGARAARRRPLVFLSDIVLADGCENPFPFLRYEFGDHDLGDNGDMDVS